MNSRNNRKFKLWDSKVLAIVYEQVLQIKTRIEAQCSDNIGPEDLPMSAIPSDVLYDIAACYVAMYDKLYTDELVTSGYPKQTNTIH